MLFFEQVYVISKYITKIVYNIIMNKLCVYNQVMNVGIQIVLQKSVYSLNASTKVMLWLQIIYVHRLLYMNHTIMCRYARRPAGGSMRRTLKSFIDIVRRPAVW